VDVNGDGYLDYCRNVGGTVNCAISKFMDSRIDKVTEGTGSNTSIVYQSIAEVSPAPIYTKDATGPYPMVSKQIPVYVVASSARSDGMGGSVATNYTYGGLKAEIGPGRGLLGFRWISAKNAVTNIENYSEYRQDWPYVGMLLKSETRLPGAGNAGVLKRTTLSSACQVPQTGAACTVAAGNRYFAYVASSLEESWDLNQTAYPSVTTNYAYGQNPQYGDPTQITVNISDGSSKTTDNEYYPADTTNWILGRLKKASVTSVQP
jgi:hypothetical protein